MGRSRHLKFLGGPSPSSPLSLRPWLVVISLLRPTLTYFSWTDPYTERAHFPSTVTSASLKSMLLNHGPCMSCRPSGPFEEDGGGPPIFSKKNTIYFHFSILAI